MDYVSRLLAHATDAERRAYPRMSEADANRLLARLKRAHHQPPTN